MKANWPLLLQVKSQSLPVPPWMVKQFRCAFFNFTAEEGNRTGGWSYRGVETDVINTTHVRCIASHLTSFVVLVSFVPSVGEPVSGIVLLNFDTRYNCYSYMLIHQHSIYIYILFHYPHLSFSLQPALDYITYIGCSISLLCLLACIVFYLTLRWAQRFNAGSHSLQFWFVYTNISSEKSWFKSFTTLSTSTCALPSFWVCSSSSLEYKRPLPTL